MHPTWLLIPILVGLAQPVIWQMNVSLAKATGEMESAVLLHVVGTVVGLGWMSVGLRQAGFGGTLSAPWWALLGGAIGVTAMAGMAGTAAEAGGRAAAARHRGSHGGSPRGKNNKKTFAWAANGRDDALKQGARNS